MCLLFVTKNNVMFETQATGIVKQSTPYSKMVVVDFLEDARKNRWDGKDFKNKLVESDKCVEVKK
jgi:hypothetical protein